VLRKALAGTVFVQWKVGKTPGQRHAILRPFLGSVFADDAGHPAACGQSMRLGRLFDQRLRGLIQIERDWGHGGLLGLIHNLAPVTVWTVWNISTRFIGLPPHPQRTTGATKSMRR
jgi:hypothetical protein